MASRVPRADRLRRLLIAAPVALGVCYFALWACAPVFTAPPPTPLAGGLPNDVGIAGGTAFTVPGTGEGDGCNDGLVRTRGCVGPQLQAWYRHVGPTLEVDVVAHGGVTSLVGGGIVLRHYFLDGVGRVGLSGGVGWLSAQVGVPMAGQLTPGVWLYTEPTLAVAMVGVARVPVGLAVTTGRFTLHAETGAMSGVNLFPLAGYGALGVGYAF